MITLKITGFTNLDQAKTFAEWYSGSGEQEIPLWLSNRKKCSCEYLNVVDITVEEELETVEMIVKPS